MEIGEEPFSRGLSIYYERRSSLQALRIWSHFHVSFPLFPCLHCRHTGLLAALKPARRTLPQSLGIGWPSCWNSLLSHTWLANFIISFKSLLMCHLLNGTCPEHLPRWHPCFLPLPPNITYPAPHFPFLIAPAYCNILKNPFIGLLMNACLPW